MAFCVALRSFLGVLLLLVIDPNTQVPEETTELSQPVVTEQSSTRTQTVDGVRYTFRPATKQDHPVAVTLDNYYVLIRVEGTPPDGIYYTI